MRWPLAVDSILTAAVGCILTNPYCDNAFPNSVGSSISMAFCMKPLRFELASYDSHSSLVSYISLALNAR